MRAARENRLGRRTSPCARLRGVSAEPGKRCAGCVGAAGNPGRIPPPTCLVEGARAGRAARIRPPAGCLQPPLSHTRRGSGRAVKCAKAASARQRRGGRRPKTARGRCAAQARHLRRSLYHSAFLKGQTSAYANRPLARARLRCVLVARRRARPANIRRVGRKTPRRSLAICGLARAVAHAATMFLNSNLEICHAQPRQQACGHRRTRFRQRGGKVRRPGAPSPTREVLGGPPPPMRSARYARVQNAVRPAGFPGRRRIRESARFHSFGQIVATLYTETGALPQVAAGRNGSENYYQVYGYPKHHRQPYRHD